MNGPGVRLGATPPFPHIHPAEPVEWPGTRGNASDPSPTFALALKLPEETCARNSTVGGLIPSLLFFSIQAPERHPSAHVVRCCVSPNDAPALSHIGWCISTETGESPPPPALAMASSVHPQPPDHPSLLRRVSTLREGNGSTPPMAALPPSPPPPKGIPTAGGCGHCDPDLPPSLLIQGRPEETNENDVYPHGTAPLSSPPPPPSPAPWSPD